MKIYSTAEYVLRLPEGHRFPMEKYRLLHERVISSLSLDEDQIETPPEATDLQLSRAHDWDYIHAAQNGLLGETAMKKIGFPWSKEFVKRSRLSSGATIESARQAIREGYGINLAGGTHHAFRDHGEAYCLFNDSVLAIRAVQIEENIQRGLIIDLDVHQGNGSAAICQGDQSIFTFSMHGEKNYPLKKEKSNLDVPLPDKTSDREYLDQLLIHLPKVIELARPGIAIYVSGADAYAGDQLGRLSLTKQGLRDRDSIVVEYCQSHGIPLVLTMAGGYASNVLDTVDIHYQSVMTVMSRANRSIEYQT